MLLACSSTFSPTLLAWFLLINLFTLIYKSFTKGHSEVSHFIHHVQIDNPIHSLGVICNIVSVLYTRFHCT